ncbi:MAG: hypothetical protein JXA57_11485 [Armatimonadetes bacterium]|nr:hypothetical protein [Armatimonadota bacterium]
MIELKRRLEKSDEIDRAVGQVARYSESWKKGPVVLLACESRTGFATAPFTRRIAELRALGRPVFALAAGRRVGQRGASAGEQRHDSKQPLGQPAGTQEEETQW